MAFRHQFVRPDQVLSLNRFFGSLKTSIGRRLAFYILLFSSVVTLLSTVLQLTLDFNHDVSGIAARLEQISDSYAKSLSSSRWVSSEKDLRIQLEGIMRLPDMQRIEVVESDGTLVLAVGEPRTGGIISHDFELSYLHREKTVPLGKVITIANLDSAYQNLRDKILVILLSQGIKTFLVSLFILFLFDRLVGVHLRRIASYSASLVSDSTSQPLVLPGKVSHGIAGDELDLVVVALDGMQARMAEAIAERDKSLIELKFANEHLEASVAQRTEELLATEARASHLLEASADGLYGVDQTGRVTFINPAGSAMLGYHAEQVIGRLAHDAFHHSKPDGTPYPIDSCPSHNAVLRGQEMRKDSEVYWHADGHSIPVMFAIHPMFRDGENVGSVISFVDISEQRAAALAREQALIAAENLARVRSEFLANMSHEIRTPLNGVLGFAEIGYRHYTDGEKARNAFEKIMASGRLLLGVINEILDFSKIEAGKVSLESSETEIANIMEQARELVAERAGAKGLTLRIETAVDLPRFCMTDPLRLGQVLINLLSNAVKFTERGSITLAASRSGDMLNFTVTDTGIGMTETQLEQLFNPFQQGDTSTTRRFGGTGLGLAISKRLLELMGGGISVASQVGKGSTFDFRVPYVPVANSGATKKQAADTVVSNQSKPLVGMTILVAEDDETNQIVIETNLADDGANVVIVGNGRAAVEQIRQAGPVTFDAVLMDIQMPEMDGYQATEQILALVPGLPIIGQTAHASVEDQQKCLEAGMVAHVTKPINFTALADLLRQYARST